MMLLEYLLVLIGVLCCTAAPAADIPQDHCKAPPYFDDKVLQGDWNAEHYVPGTLASYTCRPGFIPSGSIRYICAEGIWEALASNRQCTRIGEKCGPPPVVQNGDITEIKKLSYDPGSSVQYQCANYYTLDGNTRIKCEQGEWEKAPICRAPCTVTYTDMEKNNIYLTYWHSRRIYSEHLDYIQFRCKPGYEPSKTNPMRVQCVDGVMPLPKCLLPGIGEKCGPPPTVQHGDTTGIRKLSYDSGSSVQYQCANFYRLDGESRIKCEDGEWEKAPICRVPCTVTYTDMEKNNVYLAYRNDKKMYSEHLDYIQFTCKPGYEKPKTNPMRVQCVDGEISLPKCLLPGSCVLQESEMFQRNIYYGASPEVGNGETIEFKCTEGAIAEGKLDTTCIKGTIQYPKCVNTSPCVLQVEEMDARNISYDGSTKQIQSGQTITFTCAEGMIEEEEESLEATCINGNIKYPKCVIPKPCNISGSILEENHIELVPKEDHSKIYQHDTTIDVKCRENFKHTGNPRATCFNGIIKVQKCFGKSKSLCRINQQLLDDNFLYLNEKYNDDTYYEEGDAVRFKCKTGYSAPSEPIGICSKPLRPPNAQPVLIYPTCTQNKD